MVIPVVPIYLLLVDDEKDFIETVAQRLNIRRFSDKVVFNGKDALKKIENDKSIDVVIMDISMPKFDGLEVLQIIKKIRPLIEVIMLTGHVTIQSAIDSIKLGAFDYLIRPCDTDVLVEKINAAVKRKRHREYQIFQIRIEPYITAEEKKERISKIIAS
jgi:DNA-binding NtrC family response regulator